MKTKQNNTFTGSIYTVIHHEGKKLYFPGAALSACHRKRYFVPNSQYIFLYSLSETALPALTNITMGGGKSLIFNKIPYAVRPSEAPDRNSASVICGCGFSILRRLSPNLRDVSQNLRDVSQNLRGVSPNLRRLSQNLRDISQNLRGVSQNLRGVSQNLRGVSQNLRDAPSDGCRVHGSAPANKTMKNLFTTLYYI
jgi:hypothetical protein